MSDQKMRSSASELLLTPVRRRYLALVTSRRDEPYGLLDASRTFLFAVLPALLVVVVLEQSNRLGLFALDFHYSFWPAGRSVLHGNFAYDPSLSGADPYVYPPLTAVLLAPLAALPVTLAAWLYTTAGVVGVVTALSAFGVRDWRCYGAAFLWPPVLAAIQAGNVTLLLLGGIGLAWLVRARPIALGLAIAVVVSTKLFLWPLVVWLPLSRRFRAAAWAACFLVTLNAVSWVAVDAGSVNSYVHLLKRISTGEAWDTYTLKVVMARIGFSHTAGWALTWLVVAALIATWWNARGDDRFGLGWAVVVALVASPIVWLHYLALLLVPVALLRRTLHWIWLVPAATLFCPGKGSGTAAQAALGVAVVAAIAAAGYLATKEQGRRARPA